MKSNLEDNGIDCIGQDLPEEKKTTIEESTNDKIEVIVDSPEAQLEETITEREQFKALLQRVQADFLNYKKRVEEEQSVVLQRASITMLLKFLPILDDFSNAFNQITTTTDEDQSWLEGIRIINRKLWTIVQTEGVSTMEVKGRPFNPLEHEAIGQEETTEHPENTVIRVIRDGLKMNELIIRPAQVIVAKKPEAKETTEISEAD